MKVSELINKLNQLPQDNIVVYCEYGGVDGLCEILGASTSTCNGFEVDLPNQKETDIVVLSS